MKAKHVPLIGVIGGVVVVIGSFLPWANAHTVFGTISVAGMEGDGKITALGGVLVAGLAAASATRSWLWLKLAGAVAALGLLVVAGYEYASVSSGLTSDEYAVASVGNGLYVVLAGAFAALVAAIFHLFLGNSREPASAPA